MELRHLRSFVTVAEELHFTRAAARLQTAQPGLSKQIRQLERELGVELFVRAHHSVELTDAGRVLLESVRRVLDETDQVRRNAQQAARGDLGQLTVGFVPEAAGELLPELLGPYRAQHPHVDLTLHELPRPDLINGLIDGQIQVGLQVDPPRPHREEPQLHFLRLRRQRLVVAMHAQHRLAHRRSLRLRELADEQWIQTGGRSSRLVSACAKVGFEPMVIQPARTEESRLALVASGIGVALVGGQWATHHLSSHLVYKPLERPTLTVDTTATWRKDRPSAIVDGFLDIARTVIRPASLQPH
jgi:DNA-binding transcriptional LysR family regulator